MKLNKLSKYILSIIVGLYALISLYPLLWMLLQSVKTDLEFFSNQFMLPKEVQWQNFAKAWEKANFSIYYKNSIIVTVVSVFLIIVVCSLLAYALVKIEFKGKRLLNALIVSVMFLPGSMLLFPVFMIARSFGIVGTHAGLVGPYVAGALPIVTLIFTTAMKDIPSELVDSAKIDGCNHFRIWRSIMLPLTKSTIATICIVQGMRVWNEFMWALITLTDKDSFTLPIGLHDIADKVFQYGYGTIFSGMTMTTLPILIAYALLQKQFVKAVTGGAVKG